MERHLSIPVWSFALLQMKHQPLRYAIARSSIPIRPDSFEEQTLVNSAWSFAAFQNDNMPLFSALSASSRRPIQAFQAHGLATISWSVALRGLRNEPWLPSI